MEWFHLVTVTLPRRRDTAEDIELLARAVSNFSKLCEAAADALAGFVSRLDNH